MLIQLKSTLLMHKIPILSKIITATATLLPSFSFTLALSATVQASLVFCRHLKDDATWQSGIRCILCTV